MEVAAEAAPERTRVMPTKARKERILTMYLLKDFKSRTTVCEYPAMETPIVPHLWVAVVETLFPSGTATKKIA
jgi:hypothetical protein